MIYKDLSLSSGGGIIPNFQLVDSNGCENIIIGLGGTGIDCLKEVKKQVYNRIKPDDSITSDIPTYQNIQFLAIDSDRNSINDVTFAGIDPMNEYFDIGCSDIHSILGHSKILRQTPSLRWLSDRIQIYNAQSGAGGVRQVGRLLMMTQSDRLKKTIIYKVTSALLRGLAGAKLKIHIFTGMGGGTGSGVFLDICYIIRHIIEEFNLERRPTIAGYFFLPDVNLQRIHDGYVRHQIEINGFAAMKELDHCMNFDKNGGEWNQEYVNYNIISKQAPVDNAYLISATDIDGNIRKNGYKYAIDVVADYVTESLIHPFCLYPVMPPAYYFQKKTGACYNYYALGGVCAYVPHKEICTYLASRIFEAYRTLPSTNHDIDAFISDNGLTYRDFLNDITKDVKRIPVVEVDRRILIDQIMGITPDIIPPILSQMIDTLREIKGVLASNRERQAQNVIVDIKNKLIEIATVQGKGLVYASLFLSNHDRSAKDLSYVIDGYIKENDNNRVCARANLTLHENSIATTLRELQNARLHRQGRARSYVYAVYSYYTQLAKIFLYEEMDVFFNELKCRIRDLYETFFAPINAMFANVAETFNHNYHFLTEGVPIEDEYALKIIGLDDNVFKNSLDLAVESIDTKKVVNDFVSYIIKESDEWLYRSDDSKICAAVSSFFIQNFSEFMHKNIDFYLQEKFQAPTQSQLVDMLYHLIMIPLRDRAKPLFWTSERLDEVGRFGYCFIPNSSMIISEAASRMTQADSCFRINTSGSFDSISMFTLYCGVPMYMYQRIFDYRHKYDQSVVAGVHIYEGTELDPRDFRKLRGIIPLSLYSEDELKDVKDFVNDYDRAVKNGIIYKERNGVSHAYECQLRLVDDEDLLIKKEQIKAIIKKCSNASEEYNKCIEEAKAFLKDDNNIHIKSKDCIILPNDGFEEYEDSVVRDHVFASEYYTSVLLEQLKKIDELDSMIQRLQQIAHSQN